MGFFSRRIICNHILLLVCYYYSCTTTVTVAALLSSVHYLREANSPLLAATNKLPQCYLVTHHLPLTLLHGHDCPTIDHCIYEKDAQYSDLSPLYSSISNGDIVSEASNLSNVNISRRNFIVGISTATAFLSQQSAHAIENPLNLKGTFWETGQLYEKQNTSPSSPDDDDDFFSILDSSIEALHSPTLTDAITQAKYKQASRLLRGGLISESKIRIAANALIDSIPEENDVAFYRSSESFRLFLRCLDVLDAEVEAASRPVSFRMVDGEGGDPRMKILSRLGEVEESLKEFVKNVKGGV